MQHRDQLHQVDKNRCSTEIHLIVIKLFIYAKLLRKIAKVFLIGNHAEKVPTV